MGKLPRVIPGLCALVLAAGPATAADPLPADTVVARRGTATVTMADVDAQVAGLPREARAGYMNDPQRIERLLTGMLLARQLANEAEEAALDEKPLFDEQMRLQRDNLLMTQMTEHYLANLEVPDFTQLARERYQANPDQYRSPEKRDIRHISVSSQKLEDARAREVAEKARDRLLAGDSFDEVARLYSDDKPADGGLLGTPIGLIEDLEPGKTEKSFDVAAFALAKPGDISPVVKTSYGYHVIRLESIEPSGPLPFEAVAPQLVERMKKKWIDDRKAEYLAGFRNMEIEAEPDVVASLRTRYQGGEVPGEAAR